MFNYTPLFTKTRQGREKLILAGYAYTKKNTTLNLFQWRCVHARKCKSSVWLDQKTNKIEKFIEHNHGPQFSLKITQPEIKYTTNSNDSLYM